MQCAWCQTYLPITSSPNTRWQFPDGTLGEPFTVCADCAEYLEVTGRSEDGMNIIEAMDNQDD